jgi:hypothetical protein
LPEAVVDGCEGAAGDVGVGVARPAAPREAVRPAAGSAPLPALVHPVSARLEVTADGDPADEDLAAPPPLEEEDAAAAALAVPHL